MPAARREHVANCEAGLLLEPLHLGDGTRVDAVDDQEPSRAVFDDAKHQAAVVDLGELMGTTGVVLRRNDPEAVGHFGSHARALLGKLDHAALGCMSCCM